MTYANGVSIIYDNEYQAYKIERTTYGFGSVLLNDLSLSNKVQIECDFYSVTNQGVNNQPRFGLFNQNNQGLILGLNLYSDAVYIRKSLPITADSSDGDLASSTVSDLGNKWINLKIKYDGSNIETLIYYNNQLQARMIGTADTLNETNNKLGFQHCHTLGAVNYLKNIKVKAL